MATLPTPRSLNQIIGRITATIQSRSGITLQAGDPTRSIIEAAAQSDFRSSNDIFQALASTDLDKSTGLALDRIGASELVFRPAALAAAGTLTFTDSRYTKISSKIYQGLGGVSAPSTVVYVEDGSKFAGTGNIYIGRGTSNAEGPLAYTSCVNSTGYWTITLSTPTQKYHAPAEEVVFAQGGTRTILAGQTVQTSAGPAGAQYSYKTLVDVVIPDGEVSVTSVRASATIKGVGGNAPIGSLTTLTSLPFPGAAVTNPTPFSNGREAYNDDLYRELIRTARANRSKGTPSAITAATIGALSTDENKRVVSSQFVTRQSEPSTLFIDDGTGYEAVQAGVSIETLTDSATGGELYFSLAQGRPVAKAYVESSVSAPYFLTAGSKLAVSVGGVLNTHSFESYDFTNISSASAYEIVASINANPAISFGARTSNGGTKVVIYGKQEKNEDIQVAVPAIYTDANGVLGFSTSRVYTLALYKNDRLLVKDGTVASINTLAQTAWSAISSGATLNITVDGIALSVTFNDVDFSTASTGYNSVSKNNSLAAWAKVINAKIPGVTAIANNGYLTLTSNLGASSRAQIVITGGTLSSAMFSSTNSAVGTPNDYSLDRNLGLIKLTTALTAGDSLRAGTIASRAFIQSSSPITNLTIGADVTNTSGQSGAELWFVVDGTATAISTGVTASTQLVFTSAATMTWGIRARITTSSALWTNVVAGDWAIFQDAALALADRGAYRVAQVDSSGFWIEIEKLSTWTSPGTVTLTAGNVFVTRASVPPQRVFIAASVANTASGLAASISSQLKGAVGETYKTTYLRVKTNTFSGSIALVAQNVQGSLLGFSLGRVDSSIPHLGAVTSRSENVGTVFTTAPSTVSAYSNPTSITLGDVTGVSGDTFLNPLKPLPDSATQNRFGEKGQYSIVTSLSGSAAILRRGALQYWLAGTGGERLVNTSNYLIGPNDNLSILVDNNAVSQRYNINMYRKTRGTGNYGASITLKDFASGSNVILGTKFGNSFDFTDFAVLMSSRVKSHANPDTNKTILWRTKILGGVGLISNNASIAYDYPQSASAAIGVGNPVNQNNKYDFGNTVVYLASGAARTSINIRNGSGLGVACTGNDGIIFTNVVVMALPVTAGTRVLRLAYNGRGTTAFTGTINGAQSLASATVVSDSLAGGSSGSGFLTVSAPAGTFFLGEAFTGATGAATTASAVYGATTLTVTLPAGVTNHGFNVGDVVYVTNVDASFSSGTKTISVVGSGTTFTYNDVASTATMASFGSVSVDDSGEVNLVGSTVTTGDIVNFNGLSGNIILPTITTGNTLQASDVFARAFKMTLGTGNRFITGDIMSPNGLVSFGTLEWFRVSNAANVQFYPLGSNGITTIAAAVNAISTSPVTAVAVGTGADTSGVITAASYEMAELDGGTYAMTDCVNWVSSQSVTSGDYTFTLKFPTTSSLALNSDWANEDVRLVPRTALNVVNWLNSFATSGLSSVATASLDATGTAIQLNTNTAGRGGSINVTGGSANSSTAVIQSVTSSTGGYYISILASDAAGFIPGQTVKIQNSIPATKPVVTSSTALSSISATGVVVLSGANAWTWANTAAVALDNSAWQFEKAGQFVAVSTSSQTILGIRAGDYVIVEPPTTPVTNVPTVNSLNQGIFRIVSKLSNAVFTIENTNVIEEYSGCKLRFIKGNSILPGDKLTINTTLWGTANVGTWTVKSIDLTNQFTFTLDTIAKAVAAQGAVSALGTNSNLIFVNEGSPTNFYIKIGKLAIDPANPAYVAFPGPGASVGGSPLEYGVSLGSTVIAPDKLAFPTTFNTGIDGYAHNTGLLAEVNRIVYGDERNSITYPGYAAAGSSINIEGPIVKRIKVGLAIRTNSGTTVESIITKIQSAVATVINQSPVGKSIDISSLLKAARSVAGVSSVVVTSPTYTSASDLIAVQPSEKPFVIDVANDIAVTIIGT